MSDPRLDRLAATVADLSRQVTALQERPTIQAYTLTEAAGLLRIGKTTLDKLIDAGEIHVVRWTPDTPRILLSELERFAEEKQEAEAWSKQPAKVVEMWGEPPKSEARGRRGRATSGTRSGRGNG
jgi:excisionase family DNA binding protein